MENITYAPNTQYSVAILIKSYLVGGQYKKIKEYYVDPLVSRGIRIEDIIVIGLPYTDYKKCSAATMKQSVPLLQEFMDTCGCQHVLVADTPYLKKLAKLQNLANLSGVLLPNVMGPQRLFKALLYTTYQFNDKAAERVNLSLDALVESYKGKYREKDILKNPIYPHTSVDIKRELDKLLDYPALAVDIEGFGLRLDDAGVATIGFAYSIDSGIAFGVDYREDFQEPKPNWEIRSLVKDFLEEYSKRGGITYYHGIAYDVKHLVANVFMKNDLLDYKAMVDGVELLTTNAYCTKDIAYLATNSAAGNILNLKHLALEYTGRYAIDVKDIRKHPLDVVLEYNLKDCCATYWIYEKNYPTLKSRNQEELYLNHFQTNQRTLITMELTGMPLDMPEVLRLRTELDTKEETLLFQLRNTTAVQEYVEHRAVMDHAKYQNSVKGAGHTLEYFKEWKADKLEFKPTQDRAIVWILHEYFALPIIDKTLKAREPSVADDTLQKHVQWIESGNVPGQNAQLALSFLQDVREYLEVQKINGTFVKAFITKSIRKKDGIYYLHGSINQGGTISARLSSNDPNMQNLPSGSHWGKAIKKCFKAPPGKVMLGPDFNALEARIGALRTKDPNMLKVYTDGFDSHSLNTYAYADGTESWYSMITDPEDPQCINLIMKLGVTDRKNSKPTTFALQFFGNYKTLMNNQGYSEEKSKRLVDAFHKLYAKYFETINDILDQGMKDGYVTVAFGLRIDTPAMAKSIANTSVTPATVDAERRSVGNAISQSYGQMNTKAADDFMRRVWASKYRYTVHMQNVIHDAIYTFGPSDLECVKWVNDNLIECMCMQTDPHIQHPDVGLEAELDIFYPTWADSFTVPNSATEQEIQECIKQALTK